ncbi:MAG TPA: class I SAM-dependent methyltransferase [Phycisphaerae bacterium]|nr:class I SAM-dependent methyltransferase [Phycisphaerae bacterium]HOM53657.1 class I SAM-dependent methyltransferase [Phycisphaerae bacterium]HOQ87820.1 class I SAM-dependent methyltransferase [Phycisphaerae bacterium]HPP29016.1 class I SAM-dependent methyltransferase [Phycisphaerae bacterium]HPZ97319.1 class I SAM-dependent methyltransferase [Phycisphaerae bacterium]
MGLWPEWQWNEIQQVGTDYTDVAEVQRYESRMQQFRDLAAEDQAILAELNLPPNARVLEIGTGTGHFARTAARAGCTVVALDVSPVMLEYAASRAREENLTSIEFRHAGFLTFSCPPASFDAAVSVAVLHHLPDLWKAVALHRVHEVLKPGGRFLLRDVVFSWEGGNHAAAFDGFVNGLPTSMRTEAARHIAKEYSTLDWIMHGLLERAGFNVLRAERTQASFVHYLCEKAD